MVVLRHPVSLSEERNSHRCVSLCCVTLWLTMTGINSLGPLYHCLRLEELPEMCRHVLCPPAALCDRYGQPVTPCIEV